jgi:hypothetical protein
VTAGYVGKKTMKQWRVLFSVFLRKNLHPLSGCTWDDIAAFNHPVRATILTPWNVKRSQQHIMQKAVGFVSEDHVTDSLILNYAATVLTFYNVGRS